MKKLIRQILIIAGCTMAPALLAATTTVTLKVVTDDNKNQVLGTVELTDTKSGLLIKPALSNLKPGLHGFHIHEHPSCANLGMAAGGHLDPKKTGKHLGPYNNKGHLGDLPALYVADDGQATLPTLAPRLQLRNIAQRALMLHSGGDNYEDTPPMGGGGTRYACGIVLPK